MPKELDYNKISLTPSALSLDATTFN